MSQIYPDPHTTQADLSKYTPTDAELATLDNTFRYHAPKADQLPRYALLREALHRVGMLLLRLCPPSRERTLAMRSLEEAGFYANAAIARNE